MYIKTYDRLSFVKTQIIQYYGLVKIKHKFTLIFPPKLQKTNLENKIKACIKTRLKTPFVECIISFNCVQSKRQPCIEN